MVAVKVVLGFFVGVFAFAPEALAIDPGVVYEPGSPAAKEYALPLEEARREAGSPGSEGAAPSYGAFGVGIGPRGRGGGGQSDRAGDGERGGAGGGDGSDAHAEAAVSRAGLADAEAAGGSFGWTMLIVLAVLLPGALLGFTLGRLQRGRAAGHGPRKTSASRGAQRSTE